MKKFLAILMLSLVAAARAATPPTPAAEDEIRHLLQFVRDSQATFIRNGKEYPPEEATAHMQRKWDYHRKQISTADDFIRLTATRSLFSGKLYQIRLADGTTLESGAWLTNELVRHRASENAPPPSP